MKKLPFVLLPVLAFFFALSLSARAGTDMKEVTSCSSCKKADAGYWLPAPPISVAPTAFRFPPTAYYYTPPACHPKGTPPYRGNAVVYYGAGYYGYGSRASFYAPATSLDF
jgi:hypothetical protein